MDPTRYEQLTVKRDDVSLTDEETDELGKMMAEIESSAGPELDRECGHDACKTVVDNSEV